MYYCSGTLITENCLQKPVLVLLDLTFFKIRSASFAMKFFSLCKILLDFLGVSI